MSESIIKEIIELVAYNKSKQSYDHVFPKPKPMSRQAPTSVKEKSPEIQIRKSLIGDNATASNLMSPSVASSFGGMSLSRRKAKLKVNNVLIDNEEEEEEAAPNPEKDYILINSVTHEEQINSLK